MTMIYKRKEEATFQRLETTTNIWYFCLIFDLIFEVVEKLFKIDFYFMNYFSTHFTFIYTKNLKPDYKFDKIILTHSHFSTFFPWSFKMNLSPHQSTCHHMT